MLIDVRITVALLDVFVKLWYAVRMTGLPPDIQARRLVEDRAAKLGVARKTLEVDLNSNTAEVRALLREAEGSGVSYDLLAQLIGVSRQTLYHWRELDTSRGKQ